MKLILQKTNDFNEVNKVIEILSTEINDNSTPYFIKENETIIIKYTDTEEQFSIKDISSKTIFNNSSETLIIIRDTDLIPLGGSGSSYTPPYKVYTALLTQSGTNAPVATVLENTLGFTPIWQRDSPGNYYISNAGQFPINKTHISSLKHAANYTIVSYAPDGDSVWFEASEIIPVSPSNYAPIEGLLVNISIEIRVYN